MRFLPPPLIPRKCKRDNEVVGPPSKRRRTGNPLKRKLGQYKNNEVVEPPSKRMQMDPDYVEPDCKDIEMMDDIAPVNSNVGRSNLLSGSVGSQNTVAQTALASIDVLEPEQSTPDNQGVPETEVRQYFRSIACKYSVVTPQALNSQNDRLEVGASIREPEQPTKVHHEPEQETEVHEEPLYQRLYQHANSHGLHGQALGTRGDSQEVIRPNVPIRDFLTGVCHEPERESDVRQELEQEMEVRLNVFTKDKLSMDSWSEH